MSATPNRWIGCAVAFFLLSQWALPVTTVAAAPAPTTLLPAWFGPPPQPTQQSTTLSITKSDTPDPVNQGGWITYRITVTNQTAEVAHQVIVTDTTPPGTVFHSASVINGGGSVWFHGGLSPGESGDYVWFTGDRVGMGSGLPGNHSAVLEFVVRAVGPFVDQSQVHNDTLAAAAINAPPVTGEDVATTVNAPAFTLGKVAASDPISAGERLEYTITLTNSGHLTATRPYTIVETLPDCTQYVTSSPPAQQAGGVLTWTLDTDLGIGESITTTFQVTVTAPFTCGVNLVNDEYLAFSTEVTPTAHGPAVTTAVRAWPILSITKSDAPDPVEAGATITYRLIASNATTATAAAQSVLITDTLPTYTLFQSCQPACMHSGQAVTWTLSTLQPGESRALTLTARTYSPLPSGTLLTNRAAVSATNALATAATSAQTTIHSAPVLAVTKTAQPAAVLAGRTVTYTITVANSGNETAVGTVITDRLPTPFTFGGMVQGPAPTVAGNVLTWTGQTVTGTIWPAGWIAPPGPLTLVFTATAGGVNGVTYYNAVTVTSGAASAATGPTAPVLVSTPDLRLTKSDTPDPVMPGQRLTYTLVYSNASPVGASGVVVTDTLPAFITGGFAVPPPSAGVIAAGQTITWNVGPLAGNSGNRTITLVVTVTQPLADGVVLTNRAGIACAEGARANSGPVTTTVASGPVHHFAFAPIADQVAGVDFTLAITAYDAHNNVAGHFNGTVTLSDPTGSLHPTTSDPFVNGVLAAQTISITTARVNQPIRAISGTINNPSNPFTVTHNLAVALSLSPRNGTFQAGQTPAYTAVATDAFGNRWTATSEVTFTTSGGNAFLGAPPGNNVFSATVAGVNFPITGTIAGAGGPVVATTGVTVTHGAAAALDLAPQTATVVAGSWVTYTAVATDAFGNAWEATGQATYAAGGGNAFPGVPPGNHILSATVAGTWSVTGTLGSAQGHATVTILPAPLHHFALTHVPTQTAGVPFPLTISARDRFGNLVPGFSGTVALTDTTSTLIPLTWSTWVNGVATPNVTVFRAWSDDLITVTLVATPTVWGVSNPFDVLAGPAHTLVYQTPPTMPICSRAVVTATLSDVWGNPANDGTVITLTAYGGLTFAESGSNTYLPRTAGGRVNATLVAPTFPVPAATTAAAAGVAPVIRAVNVVTPGLPSTLDLSAAPTTIQVFTDTATLAATVRDCAGNPLPGVTVAFQASLGQVQPVTATTGPTGQATAVFSSSVEGTAVITATADGLSDQVVITVLPSVRRLYLPLVTRNYRGVNLIVEGIVITPTSPAPNQTVVVSVTVRNAGAEAVNTSFWVDLYLDPSALPTAGVRWDQLCAEGVAWRVTALAAGEAVTLRSDQGAPSYTYWTGRLAAQPNPHRLYAIVDVWPGATGAVAEDREDDNRLGPVEVFMGAP
jgi:uncharacterized repeat protein (TIGR01451 family)